MAVQAWITSTWNINITSGTQSIGKYACIECFDRMAGWMKKEKCQEFFLFVYEQKKKGGAIVCFSFFHKYIGKQQRMNTAARCYGNDKLL